MAVAYRRRPSQCVQALSADVVSLLAELRLSRHGAKLAGARLSLHRAFHFTLSAVNQFHEFVL